LPSTAASGGSFLTSLGGIYASYLQAGDDAATFGNCSATSLACEMQKPQFDTNGVCSANFLGPQSTGRNCLAAF